MPEEEPNERERLERELQKRRARARSDSFSQALGDAWVTEGDGIYRYMPEPGSLNVNAPPPEDQTAPEVQDDLEDALAPGRRRERVEADEDASTGAKPSVDDELAKRGTRSIFRRRP